MKILVLSFFLAFTVSASFANNNHKLVYTAKQIDADTVKLLYDGTHVYYQKVINVDTISEGSIYLRAVEYMASQNIQQNYGDEDEGKLIFTTMQDLNLTGYDPSQFTAQFTITLDMKNGRYRYTVNNAVFFHNNNRTTLGDVYKYMHATLDDRESKNNFAFGRTILVSFERYLNFLLNELHEYVINKAVTSSSKF